MKAGCPHVCESEASFTTRRGLTNHRRSCLMARLMAELLPTVQGRSRHPRAVITPLQRRPLAAAVSLSPSPPRHREPSSGDVTDGEGPGVSGPAAAGDAEPPRPATLSRRGRRR